MEDEVERKMKAIKHLTKADRDHINMVAKERVAEWLKKNEEHIVRRKLKIVCIALNDEFGFGAKRLAKLIFAINRISKEWDDNPCYWTMVDRRLEQMGLPFEKENYEELEY
jgi:hypothetical protein